MLTPREIETLQLLACGRSNKEIAQAMGLALRTVKMHLSNITFKAGMPRCGRIRLASSHFAIQQLAHFAIQQLAESQGYITREEYLCIVGVTSVTLSAD